MAFAEVGVYRVEMSRGVYLVLHDFNNPESDRAIERAVKAFLADKPEPPVEIGDVWGSVLFRKIRDAG